MIRDDSRRFFTRLRGSRGATLVEAALITPLLMLLTFSIVDFGSIFYVYLSLENGVSQATRYGITGNVMLDINGNQMSRTDSIMTAMRNATPTLTLPDNAFTFSYLSPGSSTWSSGAGGPDDIQKVTVDYTWTVMTPLIAAFFPGGTIHFTVESSMKDEPKFQ